MYYDNNGSDRFIASPDDKEFIRQAVGFLNDNIEELNRERDISHNDIENLLPSLMYVVNKYDPTGWVAYIDYLKTCTNAYEVAGWAYKPSNLSSQFISFSVGTTMLYESFLADMARQDVLDAGFGTGRYGYRLAVESSFLNEALNILWISDPETNAVIAFKLMRP